MGLMFEQSGRSPLSTLGSDRLSGNRQGAIATSDSFTALDHSLPQRGLGKRWRSADLAGLGGDRRAQASSSTSSPTVQGRASSRKPTRDLIGAKQTKSGSLNTNDGIDPNYKDPYHADDYALQGVKAGQRVQITLTAKFNAHLELLNARTGKPILYGQDISINNTNARLVFTAKRGAKYLVRVTSDISKQTGTYLLKSATTTPKASAFNFFYGYGLVNASAAVSKALGQAAFANVPNLGGDGRGLDLVNAPEVWAKGYTGQGITVAVLDDGVDKTHPDLASNIWRNPGEIANNGLDDDANGFIDDITGWDFADGDNDATDTALEAEGHGTHVAGIIAAARDGVGITGVAPNAKIMPIRVDGLQASTAQFDVDLAAGIRYAVRNGANVINMSLGLDPGFPSMTQTRQALRLARNAGVVVVSASGNEREDYGTQRPIEPALFATQNLTIAVGAIGFNKRMEIYSNPAGLRPINFVVAPGGNVRSTVLQGGYDVKSGTSMAAPYVAGVAALLLSAKPNLTPAQVETLLTSTATSRNIQLAP